MSAPECVCTNLRMSSRLAARVYDDALAPVGLTSTQYAILSHIERNAPIALMAVATNLSLERTTLYRALAILEKNGWVRMRQGAGIAETVELTASGRALHARAHALWRKTQRRVVERFGERRWGEFVDTLRMLTAQLGEDVS